MKLSSIQETNQIYTCSKNASISWRSVKFSEFQIFTYAVQSLVNAVGELDEDDYWFNLIRKIRKLRFDAIAAIFSETILQERLQELIDRLRTEQNRFNYSHPNAVEQYAQLLILSERLTQIRISQLLSVLVNELYQYKDYSRTAILVCETRLVTGSEQGLSSMGVNIEVISPSFLREDVSFENVIVIGPTRWYPTYVFLAPRAENLLILKYGWIRDNWKHQNVFTSPLKQKMSKLMQTVVDEPFDNSSLEPNEVLPPAFDFQQLQKRVAEEIKGHNEIDYVKAKLFLLEEDWAVLLDADETSTVLVIDLGDLVSPVKKVKANQIEPGMFVLLRTTGGGDFIIPVADQIMGENGIKAREYQRHWKSSLRLKVVDDGYKKVINALRKYGSPRANPTNIRNWMSERNIKTEDRNDFTAILKLLELDGDSNLYWNLMENIDHAHRQAGHRIRKMLLDKVKNSDPKTLKRTGKMDFELDSENGISITAYQIKIISPETLEVLPWQIGNPIRQGD